MTVYMAVEKLLRLGYELRVDGGGITYRHNGPIPPDPAVVKPCLETIRLHKSEALDYLARRLGPLPACRECPWYMDNPWTHYPDLQGWCGYWWDHLLGPHNAQCRDRREGRVPEPAPKTQENEPVGAFLDRSLARGKGLSYTCFECRHFEAAAGSPNPRQAWGRCPQTGSRYGVSGVCNDFSLGAKSRKTTFNRTNENIEWASWTWNPVTGCRHGCPYCYAKPIAQNLYGSFEPRFHPDRLAAPAQTPPPKPGSPIGERNVFVCSMADLFGAWVPQEWIDAVLNAVRKAPQWNFLFLTKNPARLVGIDWPPNAWVETTVDCQDRVAAAEKIFARIKASVKFLSCEPLLEPVRFSHLAAFEWLIIGPKRVGKNHEQPRWELVESLIAQAREAGVKVYLKPHLALPTSMERLREYPEH